MSPLIFDLIIFVIYKRKCYSVYFLTNFVHFLKNICHIQSFVPRALFTSPNVMQNVLDFWSHRILWHRHEALNIDKKIYLIIQFACNLRDESFKSS